MSNRCCVYCPEPGVCQTHPQRSSHNSFHRPGVVRNSARFPAVLDSWFPDPHIGDGNQLALNFRRALHRWRIALVCAIPFASFHPPRCSLSPQRKPHSRVSGTWPFRFSLCIASNLPHMRCFGGFGPLPRRVDVPAIQNVATVLWMTRHSLCGI